MQEEEEPAEEPAEGPCDLLLLASKESIRFMGALVPAFPFHTQEVSSSTRESAISFYGRRLVSKNSS